jgi:carbamoyltransferase
MKILGLSSGFHDSSAALVIDGKLVAAASEERFTRQKHDANFPRFATEFCLEQAGLRSQDLDKVVFYERPFDKWIRVLDSSLAHWPKGRTEFVESQLEWLGKKLWTKAALSARLMIEPAKISEIGHHTSHLVQAFVGSSFERAAVLTVDAVGERTTSAMAELSWADGAIQIKPLAEAEFPHSLGLFYSAMTAFLGFKPMNDECTTMALAAFGEPVYVNELSRVVKFEESGFWSIDPSYLDFDRFLEAPWTPAFTAIFGSPRSSSQRLSWSSLEMNQPSESDRHWANFAASVQVLLEEALLHSARSLKARVSVDRLCFAGGVAMNCVANTRLMKESGFRELFIPVEPGDGGAAIGAAFAGAYLLPQSKGEINLPTADPNASATRVQTTTYSVYAGEAVDDDLSWLENLDLSRLTEYQKRGSPKDGRSWEKVKPHTRLELARSVAELLTEGAVVAVADGRFELGPRALGQRSILFRPDREDLARRVSRDIKDRASYRPYALALLKEEATRLLADTGENAFANPLRWMQLAISVRPEERALVRAGLHIDGTTRPQVVDRAEPLLLASILSEFKALTGLGALVNTSFNESGYPLVSSAEEALHVFARTRLDALVIGSTLIRKV